MGVLAPIFGQSLSLIESLTVGSITIFSTAWTLADQIKQLIVRVKNYHQNVQDMELKAGTLAATIYEVDSAYGPHAIIGDPIHCIVNRTVSQLEYELDSFRGDLSKLLAGMEHGSFLPLCVRKMLREKNTAFTFARLEKSIKSHQDDLHFLVTLLNGYVLFLAP